MEIIKFVLLTAEWLSSRIVLLKIYLEDDVLFEYCDLFTHNPRVKKLLIVLLPTNKDCVSNRLIMWLYHFMLKAPLQL